MKKEAIEDKSVGMSSLKFIFNIINRYPLLTKEQEMDAFKRKDYDLLVLSNLRLVVNLAKTRQNQGVELPDLVQFGIEGLCIAARRFNYKKNLRFSTFAYYLVRKHINRAVSSYGRAIRIPENAIFLMRRLEEDNRK